MTDEPAAKRMKNNDEFANLRADVAEPVKIQLVELDALQHDLDDMSEAAAEEILRVEQKYNKKRLPIYLKRKKMTTKIDNFWQTAFLNHHLLSTAIPEEQESLLSAMRDLEVQESEDLRSGFKIIMTFDSNEYFENEVITKTYNLQSETPSTQITEIIWKENKKPPVPDEEGSITFLEWLSFAAPPDSDEIAEVIKDDLFMNPLQYYIMPDMQECEVDDIDGFASKERGMDETGRPRRSVKRISSGSSKRKESEDEPEIVEDVAEDGGEESAADEAEDAEEGVEGEEGVDDEEGEEELDDEDAEGEEDEEEEVADESQDGEEDEEKVDAPAAE